MLMKKTASEGSDLSTSTPKVLFSYHLGENFWLNDIIPVFSVSLDDTI